MNEIHLETPFSVPTLNSIDNFVLLKIPAFAQLKIIEKSPRYGKPILMYLLQEAKHKEMV